MNASRKLVLRGLTRGYIVLVGLWLLYCYAWVPLVVMDANMKGRIYRGEPFDDRAWLVKYVEIVFGYAWFDLVMSIAIPLCGYGLLRLLLATIHWVKDGFRVDQGT